MASLVLLSSCISGSQMDWREVESYHALPEAESSPAPSLAGRIGLQLSSGAIVAGDSLDLTATVIEDSGSLQRSFTGVLQVTASDPSAEFPSRLEFSSADQGSKALSGAIVFRKAGVQSLTISDAQGKFSAATARVTVSHGSAVKFLISVPAQASAGSAAQVTVQAVDTFENVVQDFEDDVSIVVNGSATGAGLVDIVHGVGVKMINDVKAERIQVSLSDSGGVGLDSSSSAEITFAGGVPVSLSISGNRMVRPGQCGVLTLKVQDVFENETTLLAPAEISLMQTGSGMFYDSQDCAGLPKTSITVPEGASAATFYFRDDKEQGVFLAASSASDMVPLLPARIPYLVIDPTPKAHTVATGTLHTCVIKNGGVQCWGANGYGQLGKGPPTSQVTAIPDWVSGLPAGAGVVSISAGAYHTCALLTGGQLKCWGQNSSGELGDGTTVRPAGAVAVLGLESGVSAFSLGWQHTCAVQNGAAFCWGNDSLGRLGTGAPVMTGTPPVTRPVPVAGMDRDVFAISVGAIHSCAIQGPELKCWGSNSSQQLGVEVTEATSVPMPVAGVVGATTVAAGYDSTCALLGDGLKCWGANGYGQLGNGMAGSPQLAASDVSGMTSGVSDVFAGSNHFCAIQFGTVKCWGMNFSGQLGDGTRLHRYLPTLVSDLSGVSIVSAGAGHTCAFSNGLYCWGDNTSGQVGDEASLGLTAPAVVPGLDSGVTAVSIASNHACAVVNGGIRCWGLNSAGQLGIGNTTDSSSPVQIPSLSGVVAVTTGAAFSCALLTATTVKCWGSNTYGQLGGVAASYSASPVSVSDLGTGVSQISAGTSHVCAVKAGAAYCWGLNGNGQLGNGTTNNTGIPTLVNGLSSGVSSISAGANHTCAVVNGGVKCWGANVFGQLGDNTTLGNSVPVDVVGLGSGVSLVAAGDSHSCALLLTGEMSCWGSSGHGQLGNGTTLTMLVPMAVPGGAVFSDVAIGGEGSCASWKNGGGMSCWGLGTSGQNGDGTLFTRMTPVAVSGVDSSPVSMSRTASNTCAVIGGALYCWGGNENSMLGRPEYASTPFQVPGF